MSYSTASNVNLADGATMEGILVNATTAAPSTMAGMMQGIVPGFQSNAVPASLTPVWGPVAGITNLNSANNDSGDVAASPWYGVTAAETIDYFGMFYCSSPSFSFFSCINTAYGGQGSDNFAVTVDGQFSGWNYDGGPSNMCDSANWQSTFGLGPNGDGWHNVEFQFTWDPTIDGGTPGPASPGGWFGNFGYGMPNNYWFGWTDYSSRNQPKAPNLVPVQQPEPTGRTTTTSPFRAGSVITRRTIPVASRGSCLTIPTPTATRGPSATSAGPRRAPYILQSPISVMEQFNGTVTLGGNVTVVSATAGSTFTLNGPVNLSNYELYLTGPGAIDIEGQISGSPVSSLDDDGTANLTLSGPNGSTYQGVTTMDGGTLTATVDGALGSPAGATNVESGATLLFEGPLSYTTASNVDLADSAVIENADGNVDAAVSLTLTGNATAVAASGTTFTLSGPLNLNGYTLTTVGNVVISTQGQIGGTLVWTGAGSDPYWSDPNNWEGDVAPAGGNVLVFPASPVSYISVDDLTGDSNGNTVIQSMAIDDAGYNISAQSSQTITLMDGIVASFAGASGYQPGAWPLGTSPLTYSQAETTSTLSIPMSLGQAQSSPRPTRAPSSCCRATSTRGA